MDPRWRVTVVHTRPFQLLNQAEPKKQKIMKNFPPCKLSDTDHTHLVLKHWLIITVITFLLQEFVHIVSPSWFESTKILYFYLTCLVW